MYIEFNNNPLARRVDDCAVRAVSKALDTTWEAAYLMLALNGLQMCDMLIKHCMRSIYFMRKICYN